MRRVIGVDPGIRVTGWAVLEKRSDTLSGGRTGFVCLGTGVIKTSSNNELGHRLVVLNKGINRVVDLYNPDTASVEKVFVNSNPNTSAILYHARGALILSISLYKIPIKEYTPTYVKKSITGFGHADKLQISRLLSMMISNYKDLSINTHDESDALSLAACCLL